MGRLSEFSYRELCTAFVFLASSSTVKAPAVMRSGAIRKQGERSPSLITPGTSLRVARQELTCNLF